MDYEYMQYPSSVVALAGEIKRVTNDYNARKIGNQELRDILLWYAEKCPDKLFQGTDYNRSIKQIIGKRRLKLLDAVLDGYKLTRYRGVK